MVSVFSYDQRVIADHPTVRAGIVHATGLANGPSPPELTAAYRTEQETVAERLASTPIADLPSIAAWRRAFTRFGTKPTQYRNAAESLLRRLAKHGDLRSINTLVDMGNVVSIRYAVPVAVFDLAGIDGSITVRHAEGSEPFTDLGSEHMSHPDPGEVVFVDERRVVCARRWCWRQSQQSATSEATSEALLVIEGLHDTAETEIRRALSDLVELLSSHQPAAETKSYEVSAAHPVAG